VRVFHSASEEVACAGEEATEPRAFAIAGGEVAERKQERVNARVRMQSRRFRLARRARLEGSLRSPIAFREKPSWQIKNAGIAVVHLRGLLLLGGDLGGLHLRGGADSGLGSDGEHLK